MGRLFRMAVGVAFLALMAGLSGCVNSMPRNVHTGSTTSAAESYKPVDFRKWASGMYADEYIGRNVIADGYYQALGLGAMHQGGLITFGVKSMSAKELARISQRDPMAITERSGENVTVQAPLAMRDQVFRLRTDQRIRVYGQVVNALGSSVFHGNVTSSVLFVRANRIEEVR